LFASENGDCTAPSLTQVLRGTVPCFPHGCRVSLQRIEQQVVQQVELSIELRVEQRVELRVKLWVELLVKL